MYFCSQQRQEWPRASNLRFLQYSGSPSSFRPHLYNLMNFLHICKITGHLIKIQKHMDSMCFDSPKQSVTQIVEKMSLDGRLYEKGHDEGRNDSPSNESAFKVISKKVSNQKA